MLYQRVYTIGSEGLSIDQLLNLVTQYRIQHVIDIRSADEIRLYPFQKLYAGSLKRQLGKHDIDYRPKAAKFLGKSVISDVACSSKNYEEVSRLKNYKAGIKRLLELAEQSAILILGHRKDPQLCHRHKFIARSLAEMGCSVYHINPESSGKPRIEEAVFDIARVLYKYQVKRFYHITHTDNLPSILTKGLLCKNEVRRSGISFVSIADPQVQQLRTQRFCQGEMFDLHDFVPLFFNSRSPMLYRIMRDRTLPSQEDVIHLTIDPQIIRRGRSYFTDRNAADSMTKFYSSPEDLGKLDWEVIRSDSWYDENEALKEEKRRIKGAEVLVGDKVPVDYFREIFT